MDYEILQVLALSLGLGLLVGMQRQRAASRIAGIRTFPLVTMLGTMTALLAQAFEGWIVAAGMLSIAALIIVGNLIKWKELKEVAPNPGDSIAGQTTEAALLLMFALGAYLVVGSKTVGVALGATVAILLYLKETLHKTISRFGDKDIQAIMLFVALSLVILPVLPNQTYGPFDVLNPYNIWLMVVLIVGLSLAGYFGYKVLGDHAGTILSGILGGVISSTATTVAYARRAKESASLVHLSMIVIMIASTIAYIRTLLEVVVVAPMTLEVTAPPLVAMIVVMAGLSPFAYLRHKEEETQMPEQSNPAQLKSALIFGALYALVLLAVSAAKEYFGESGMYIVAIISGLTDMDAITLSTSNLMKEGNLSWFTGWRLIMVASLANLVFKGGLAVTLGNKQLFKLILTFFGLAIAAGLAMVFFWPNI